MNELDKLVYEKIARKDLSFGCESTGSDWLMGKSGKLRLVSIDVKNDVEMFKFIDEEGRFFEATKYLFEKNGGIDIRNVHHPIVLSDVLNYLRNNRISGTPDPRFGTMIIIDYWDFSKPFYEYQSEECKEYIRNLVK